MIVTTDTEITDGASGKNDEKTHIGRRREQRSEEEACDLPPSDLAVSAGRTSPLKRQTPAHRGNILWPGRSRNLAPLSYRVQWSYHASTYHKCKLSLSLPRLAHHCCAQCGHHLPPLLLSATGHCDYSGLH